jgi:glycosyltransferase involved in cell wall biosynthesis
MDYKLGKDKFDIYHPTYYSFSIKKRKNIKTVITVYDMGLELFLSGIKNFRNDILAKKRAIFNADYIICISKNTKQELQEIYGISDDLISVIYLGYPQKIEKSIKDKYNILLRKPYILFVGKRAPYKNFMILPKVFRELNIDKDFDLVCFGGGKFLGEELLEFRKLNLEGSIKYIEGADDLLQFYYENAYIFICPSFYEGFGLPVLEAMAFGCPVIASNIASITEISDNAVLLFSPQSVEGLCQCVKSMINDKKMRDEYIERGRKRCKGFSWEKTALETFHVYQKLLN